MKIDSRIQPVDVRHAPVLTRPYLAGGSPLAAVLAHVPELLEAILPCVAVVLGPSHLGERLKHLVILRTAVVNGCRYCTRVYEASAGTAGISADEVAAIVPVRADVRLFCAREAAALTFVDEFCRDAAASVAPLRAHYRADEIVALAAICGTTLFLTRFATAMGLV